MGKNALASNIMKLPKFLQYLIEAEKYRLVDLSTKSGINSSDLSKIINGKRACRGKSFEQLLTGLDGGHRAQALVLWLQDQIPAQFQSLVHIVRSETSCVLRKELPDIKTIEGSLAILASQAETNEAVRLVLRNMASMFKG